MYCWSSPPMFQGLVTVVCLVLLHIRISSADTNPGDETALIALKDYWQNYPPNWEGTDPCGSHWDGVICDKDRVISISLSSIGLVGGLTGDIRGLSELQALDLSYNPALKGPLPSSIGSLSKLNNLILLGCSFSGKIPDEIGFLQSLRFLSLNSNYFSGPIPAAIGDLSNLYWLDLANNSLTGAIPVSSGSTPGLDLLTNTKHFHFGQNQLSGQIPSQLFSSKMTLIHVLLEGNQLTGSIPSTLGSVNSLEVLRLDRNSLSGYVPSNLNNLTSVSELHLSNNKLTGPVPNLTGMNQLNYLDMSNNSFDMTYIPAWFSTLQSLTTIVMERSSIQGTLPVSLFALPLLETVRLRNNRINGTLDIGTSHGNQLQLIDLQDNFIERFITSRFDKTLILVGNQVCDENGAVAQYCQLPQQQPDHSYSTDTENCVSVTCPPDQDQSPNCQCSYPYAGTLIFRAPSFSDFGNSTHYQILKDKLMSRFEANVPSVDSVSLRSPTIDADQYLEVSLKIFPNGLRFNRSDISSIGFILSNQTFKPPHDYGPYYFIGLPYSSFLGGITVTPQGSKSSANIGAIVGGVAGGCVAFAAIVLAIYLYRRKKKDDKGVFQNDAFANWDQSKISASAPHLKGPRLFSYDDLKKSTNNFSEASEIGSGGYGKVYKGVFPDGQLIAIKRAQEGSLQGGHQFKTEIELLSRLHHRNLVSLVGFCFEKNEQLLVYEYIPNGSLKESLSGRSAVRLDWRRRIKVALGAGRGLSYLHELADPPIVHRDIKSSNILLDDRLNAKVSDFGLSKPIGRDGRGITTQVKGTMGYLDPEYYMSQQLTEKSDVYSFGVLLLEIITARKPIERGRYIVREVRSNMDKTKDLYGLDELLDPSLGLATPLGGFEKYVDLAVSCVEESGDNRPTMSAIVKELETIAQSAGINPYAGSASTSASYDVLSRGGSHQHPYGKEASFDYSGAYSPSQVEPK